MFAYCSLLPKDYDFTKREIVLLWMAQGFLPESEEESMEDVGDICFDDLRSRSLFEQYPYVKDRFVMHDLIHDLAQSVSNGVCYVMGNKDITPVRNWQRIRHVFVTKDGYTTLESQLSPMASQLRTVYFGNNACIENLKFIENLHYVSTLSLASKTIKVLPECIGDLQHLRFLSLRFYKVEELPTSINNLWSLQTLWLNKCYKLVKVSNISALGKLRHLEIGTTSLEEMPMGLEKLTNLQSLDKFILGRRRGARLRELKDLNHLKGALRILGLQNVSMSENAREAQLYKKSKLDKLHLEWGNERDEVDDDTKREVLEQLKPHKCIKECSLKGYKGSAFPSWLGDPCFNNMVDITLIDCEKCKCLPPLGLLPRLEKLWIEGMDGIVELGHEFYGNLTCTPTPFPALKILDLVDMKSLQRWLRVDKDRAFPCLESLEILSCNSLKGDVPPHLPSLKTLEIKRCQELSVSVPLQSLPLIEELQVEKCKILQLTTEGDLKEEHGMSPSPKGNTPCELPHLTLLIIEGGPSLISFPNGLLLPALERLEICDCEDMESLPSEMQNYTSLKVIKVCNSPKMQCFPEGCLPKNLIHLVLEKLNINQLPLFPSSLCALHIKDIPYLKSISCSSLPKLTMLRMEDCLEFESFEDHTLPPQLQVLRIIKCPKLQFFLQEVRQGGLPLPTNLKSLTITDVKLNWGIQVRGLHSLHSLRRLTLRGVNTEEDLSLPSSLSKVKIEGNQTVKNLSVVDGTTPLTDLDVWDCPKLEYVVGKFTSLTYLSLIGCRNLKGVEIREEVGIDKPIKEWGLHLLLSLRILELVDIGSCTDAVGCIQGRDDLELPSSLSYLEIGGFQNLKSIRCSTLPNLSSLTITCCPQLESDSFADSALPPHLDFVKIS